MAVVLGYQAMLGFYEFTFLALTSNEFKRKTNYCQLELSLLFNLAFYREATLIASDKLPGSILHYRRLIISGSGGLGNSPTRSKSAKI